MDTIYALASAPGKAGVAVVRLSGPQAHCAVARLCGSLPAAREARLRTLRGTDRQPIDNALVLRFDAGHSYTGEASAELHLHGSPAIVKAVLAELAEAPGLRAAEAGEFTRRALENDRMDLAQIEGLSDLIAAETEAQRKQAMRVFSGALGAEVETWRGALVRAAALLEATIDFAEEDVPVDVVPEVEGLVQTVCAGLRRQISGVGAAERIRDGFEVAIVGAPNVGKSTLLNALAGRDAAITSEFAGTTRDVIEVRMDIAGLPVTLLDTAGLRATDDQLEAIGVARAEARADAADLRIFLVNSSEENPGQLAREGDLIVLAKADLRRRTSGPAVSGLTGHGISELIANVATRLGDRAAGAGLAICDRHRQSMINALGALDSALGRLSDAQGAPEHIAEDLRSALGALEALLGRIDVEHVLDEVFARFCIGK